MDKTLLQQLRRIWLYGIPHQSANIQALLDEGCIAIDKPRTKKRRGKRGKEKPQPQSKPEEPIKYRLLPKGKDLLSESGLLTPF